MNVKSESWGNMSRLTYLDKGIVYLYKDEQLIAPVNMSSQEVRMVMLKLAEYENDDMSLVRSIKNKVLKADLVEVGLFLLSTAVLILAVMLGIALITIPIV